MNDDDAIRSVRPSAAFPFAHAAVHGGLAYVSGQVGFRPGTTELCGPGLREQALQTMATIDAILADAGSRRARIVRCGVILKRVERDFAEFNAIYASWLGTHRPARTTYGADLAIPAILVEIDCVAAVDR